MNSYMLSTNFKTPWLAFSPPNNMVLRFWLHDFCFTDSITGKTRVSVWETLLQVSFLAEYVNYFTFIDWFPELLTLLAPPPTFPFQLSEVGLALEIIHFPFYFLVHLIILSMLGWDLSFLNSGCTLVNTFLNKPLL